MSRSLGLVYFIPTKMQNLGSCYDLKSGTKFAMESFHLQDDAVSFEGGKVHKQR